jgi:WhiB family redox-sensing transcriptional regulator
VSTINGSGLPGSVYLPAVTGPAVMDTTSIPGMGDRQRPGTKTAGVIAVHVGAASSSDRLAPVIDIPEWMDHGPCGQVDPEVFFPERGLSNTNAKKVCANCPVIMDCLFYALDEQIVWGVWGGLSYAERRKFDQQREAA